MTEQRRSVRTFVPDPVPLELLAELLWRTLRVVRHVPRDDTDQRSYETVIRPIGSGGAMHATDFWLLCERVQGVPRGVWWYDPFEHQLVRVDTENPASSMWPAPPTDNDGSPPAVIGVITARHARTAWKYAGIAYALELKDVGVILHGVQLAAVALGLGMCPWGSGSTHLVATLGGVAPERDLPVGEFGLGMPPQT